MLLEPTPHAQAAEFISGKPAVGRSAFDRLTPELKARAFTVAGIEAADTLQRARDLIAELPQGADWDAQKAKLIGEISPFLVDETADPEARQKQVGAAARKAELLMRTHGFQAYAAAQHQVMDRQRDAFPLWMYMTFGDGHVRPSHAALNGIIIAAGHPFWKDHSPPWDWGCRCNKVPVTADEAREYAAAESGSAAGWVPQDAVLKRMEQTGMLDVGDGRPVDVRSPKEKADDPGTAFGWDPGSMHLPIADVLKRYDEPTAAALRKLLSGETVDVPGKPTVLGWHMERIAQPPAKRVDIPAPPKPAAAAKREAAAPAPRPTPEPTRAAFDELTDPLRRRALFGDEVVFLDGGAVRRGVISGPGGADGLEVLLDDGSKARVARSDLRHPKGGKKTRDT